MPRCLNLSELASVRYRATEILRRRRPRRAGRVRAFAANPRIHSEARHSHPARLHDRARRASALDARDPTTS